MTPISSASRIDTTARSHAVLAVFACAAFAFGAVAALSSSQWLPMSVVVLLIFVAAMTLPMTWIALVVAALLPFQFYFEIPGSSLTLRGAVVFVFVAALRLLIQRINQKNVTRWQTWVLPAVLFLLAAVVAALGAPSRYLAFKGIYDWLVIFATAFVVGEAVQSAQTLKWLIIVLVAGGVGEALLGLFETIIGTDTVVRLLQLPASDFFFQGSLLHQRLADWSINWIVFDRVEPFGTFINGIDFAVFVAAILSLTLALLLARRARNETLALLASALAMGSALILTFKGSGFLAIAGGMVTVALLFVLPRETRSGKRRLSRRNLAIAFAILIGGSVLALPFADLIVQRAAFLLQREQGAFGTAGRLEIWLDLIRSFTQRPIFGYGLHNAILIAEPQRSLRAGAFVLNQTATESAYLSALVETGLVGFGALIALFAMVLAHAFQNTRENLRALHVGVLGALVALLVGNLTVSGFTTDQTEMLLGTLIGIVFGRWWQL